MGWNRIAAWAGAALALGGGGGAWAAGTGPGGLFPDQADIGATRLAGHASFDPAADSYRVTGGGSNIWGTADSFHFAWTRRAAGDLRLAADITWTGPGADPHRKAGLMIRENLTPGSPFADVMLHGSGLASLQYRDVQDGPVFEVMSNVPWPRRIELEREGDYVYMSAAGPDGVLRHAGGGYRMHLVGPYLTGLAVSAHDNAVTETANFSHVALAGSSAPEPGRVARVESTLEVMDVDAPYRRRVVRTFEGLVAAPNWSRDGASLIYNRDGLLYRVSAAGGGEPERIETGPLRHVNDNHGLSPDGRTLAVSDGSGPEGASRIYLLPLGGAAAPRPVVGGDGAAAYWHGWSADGTTLAYVAVGPSDKADIFTKRVAGGAARRLTKGAGQNDGPEYSPDGRYIYFSSSRSGAMRLWRMRAEDGGGAEALTHDAGYGDWAPHVSPDGRALVFVSFGPDVAPGEHPSDRDITLRIMPTDGSAPPSVLTRVRGGHGTMDAPSWSPDGKSFAFVTYRLAR
jgi:TolB protein